MKLYKPAPLLIISGTPASLEVVGVYRAHFPEGEVVDMSTDAGRQRMAEILEARRAAGAGVSIDIISADGRAGHA